MKKKNENVRQILEWIGARLLKSGPHDDITIPRPAARELVTLLSWLPEGKAGRPKEWTAEIEIAAIFDMLGGKEVNALAREIAAKTGQNELSARRRLRALKKSKRFTIWERG